MSRPSVSAFCFIGGERCAAARVLVALCAHVFAGQDVFFCGMDGYSMSLHVRHISDGFYRPHRPIAAFSTRILGLCAVGNAFCRNSLAVQLKGQSREENDLESKVVIRNSRILLLAIVPVSTFFLPSFPSSPAFLFSRTPSPPSFFSTYPHLLFPSSSWNLLLQLWIPECMCKSACVCVSPC